MYAIDARLISEVARQTMGTEDAGRLADTFRMLGQPTRIRIVDALLQHELCVCDLSVLLEMKISTVSHQLARLKQHNIVKGRRDGKMIYYSLDDDHVRELFRQGRDHHDHLHRGAQKRGKTLP